MGRSPRYGCLGGFGSTCQAKVCHLCRDALTHPVPLDDERPPPGPPGDLRPMPVAGRAVAVVDRRSEEAQAGEPQGESLGDAPRDDQPVEPPDVISPVALPEGRIVGVGHGSSPPWLGFGMLSKWPTS
jgi:hypothetical protein